MFFDFNNIKPIRWLLRSGSVDDAYVPIIENLKVVNNKIVLSEIPDEFTHVSIDGLDEIYEHDLQQYGFIAENQYIVNYQNGLITFNPAKNGITVKVNYKGTGIIQYPAERIYVNKPNPWLVDNLQQFIDVLDNRVQEVNNFVNDKIKDINSRYNSILDDFKLKQAEINKSFNDTVDKIENISQKTEITINKKVAELSVAMQDVIEKINEKTTTYTELVERYSKDLKLSIQNALDKIDGTVEKYFKEVREFLDAEYAEFKAYIQEFIDIANKKIVDVNNHIELAEKATNECNVATEQSKVATKESKEVTKLCEQVTEQCKDATKETIVTENECKDISKKMKDELEVIRIDRINTRVVWQEPVDTKDDIKKKYPNPEIGWAVQTNIDGNVYRWDGVEWKFAFNLTIATPEVNEHHSGIMSSDMFGKLRDIEPHAQVNYVGEKAKEVLPNYFRNKTMVFVMADTIREGEYPLLLQFPCDGIIKSVNAFCRLAGEDYTEINIQRIDEKSYLDGLEAWDLILDTNNPIYIDFGKLVSKQPVINKNKVNKGDYFKIYVNHTCKTIKNITIEINIEI